MAKVCQAEGQLSLGISGRQARNCIDIFAATRISRSSKVWTFSLPPRRQKPEHIFSVGGDWPVHPRGNVPCLQYLWSKWTIWGKLRTGRKQVPSKRRLTSRPALEQLEDRLVPTTPSVLSINRSVPLGPETNATSVAYAVAFNEPVTGVAPADFLVTTDGSVQAATPVVVSGSGAAYTVTVNGIHGSGDLQLDLINNDTITSGGIPLGGPGLGNGSFQGQTYNILHTYPSVVSINRNSPPGPVTNASTVSFTVTFSEPVTGVNGTDFQVATTGTVGTTLTQVTPVSSSVYTVTISGITGIGTLGLNLVDNGSITDLAGNPLTEQNGLATFQAQQTFAAASEPIAVAVGDLTGDGKPDIAVADLGSETVGVLLGNGNGTFQAQQTFAAGIFPYSVAVGDLTGDGHLDLVVANDDSYTVSVLLGNGNGTFQTQQTYAVGIGPTSVALGDVNGIPDLVVANEGTDTVSVLLGNGNGTFQAQQTFAVGTSPFAAAVGDLTGAGKSDLVVANQDSDTVSVFLGNGNGTFQAQQTFAAGADSTFGGGG